MSQPLFIYKTLQININKTHSIKQPNTNPEDSELNDRKPLGLYGILSSPRSPRHKKNNKKTQTSWFEYFVNNPWSLTEYPIRQKCKQTKATT